MIDSSFKFAGIAGAMALAISASVVAQDAVQWRVEDGGNGHWYLLELTKRGWYESREIALSLGGDFVSIAGQSKKDFLVELAAARSTRPHC